MDQFPSPHSFFPIQLMNLLRISCLLLLISLGWGAGGGFGPTMAFASCGDYVHLGNGRGTSAADTGLSLSAGLASPQELPTSDLPLSGSQRCEGPSCRGALPPVPVAPSLETNPGNREILAVTASDLDRDSCVGWVQGDLEAEAAKRREGRWERPPRA